MTARKKKTTIDEAISQAMKNGQRHDAVKYCSVSLTQQEHDEFEVASSNVEYLLRNAAGVFDMLSVGLSQGYFDPESDGFLGLIEMVGRGFKAAYEDEGDKMTALSNIIRTSTEIKNDDK